MTKYYATGRDVRLRRDNAEQNTRDEIVAVARNARLAADIADALNSIPQGEKESAAK